VLFRSTSLSYLLSGKIGESKLWTADADYFKQMRCSLALGKRVTEVAPVRKEVVYQNGESDSYDTLLIATGSEPVVPAIEGMKEIPFLGFHTWQDYKEIIGRLAGRKVALIYGGGLVAMQLASGLTRRGCKAKVIVRSRILRRYFDAEAGALINAAFSHNGVDVATGSELKRVENRG
jgi:NAD(P)H-nitrite reductase large subunit